MFQTDEEVFDCWIEDFAYSSYVQASVSYPLQNPQNDSKLSSDNSDDVSVT